MINKNFLLSVMKLFSGVFALETFQQLKNRKLKMCNLLTGLKPVKFTGLGNTFEAAVFEFLQP